MGKVVIFSAPSGAGKTTLVKHAINQGFELKFSISATNRTPRHDEVNGRDYYFYDTGTFKEKIKNNELLEWEEVYENTFYGTLKSEVSRIFENGKNVIFDVDVKGGLSIKQFYGDDALAIFVMPPSIETLKHRLQKRETDTEEDRRTRLEKAQQEMKYAEKFDIILVNNDIELVKQQVNTMLNDFFGII